MTRKPKPRIGDAIIVVLTVTDVARAGTVRVKLAPSPSSPFLVTTNAFDVEFRPGQYTIIRPGEAYTVRNEAKP